MAKTKNLDTSYVKLNRVMLNVFGIYQLLGFIRVGYVQQVHIFFKILHPTQTLLIQAIFEARYLKFQNYLGYTTYWVSLGSPQATICIQWVRCSKSHVFSIFIILHPTQTLLTERIFEARYLNFQSYLGYTTCTILVQF